MEMTISFRWFNIFFPLWHTSESYVQNFIQQLELETYFVKFKPTEFESRLENYKTDLLFKQYKRDIELTKSNKS